MKIAVLGSGNGGCTLAADWAMHGHQVSLFDFPQFKTNIEAIHANDGINLEGAINGHIPLHYAGFDLERTIKDAQLVFIVGPAYSTEAFGKAVKPFAEKKQIYCVFPSSCGGAIIFKNALGHTIFDKEFTVCETNTLPYACRITKPGYVKVFVKLNGGVYLSAIPTEKTKIIHEMIDFVYQGIKSANSMFVTMLQNCNPIIHPAITILNAARIEATNGDFLFYEEGATPAAGRLIEAVDNERLAIGKKLEADIVPDIVNMLDLGYVNSSNYEDGYRTGHGLKGIKAMEKLDHRYLNEDVGYGLVFMSDLARQIGVSTPVMDSIIQIASIINKRDYKAEGIRTMKTLGLDRFSLDELKSIFNG